MKSIISKAVLATAIVSCLALGLQAKPATKASSNAVALSDTGKMAKDKMKMDKMSKKKMSKMSKGKMKMAKDSTGKM